MHDRDRQIQLLPLWARIAVPILIVVSAVLNVTALLPGVPFLEITGLVLAGPYSILKVIQLLWEHQLYPLVVLVVGFSVVFPPVKLVFASTALLKPMTINGRQRLLGALGHLGRWSLLDVFVSLLILVILSRQGFSGATVKYGLYCFLGAIVLSMCAGAILYECNRRKLPVDPSIDCKGARIGILIAGWRGWVAVVLALGLLVALSRAFFEPMFSVDKFGLVSNTWSLEAAIAFLFSSDLQVFALSMTLFLVIFPCILILSLLAVMFVPLTWRMRYRMYIWMHNITEWCMLDVFALAMVLYLSEEKNFVPLVLESGTWFLFGTMFGFMATLLWCERIVRKVVAKERVVSHLREEAAGS